METILSSISFHYLS